MSHIAQVAVEIKSLEALKVAAARCGLEFREGKQTYNWYGRSVGDYPLPMGFTASELGKCEHAIGIPGCHATGRYEPYELGVVRRRDGGEGYTLLWDFWDGGHGLEALVGQDACKLRQAYAIEAAKLECPAGFSFFETVLADGTVELQMVEQVSMGAGW